MLLINQNRTKAQHDLTCSEITFHSVNTERALLPYSSAELLTDAQQAIFEHISKADPEHTIYYTAADLPTMISDIQFYIGVNVQPEKNFERYERGIGIEPLRLNLYADVKTVWDTKPRRYQILIDNNHNNHVIANTVALMYKIKGFGGLHPEVKKVYDRRITAYFDRVADRRRNKIA
jgi:hypothetical protein